MKQNTPLLDFAINIKKLGKDTYLVRGQESWLINEIAELVCLQSNGENTIEDIINKISEEFNEDQLIVEKDIKNLLDYFSEHKIIEY